MAFKRWIRNGWLVYKVCIRNKRDTMRKTKKVVIINNNADSIGCQNGTSTTAKRANMVTGEVSGNRLKAVARTPLG